MGKLTLAALLLAMTAFRLLGCAETVLRVIDGDTVVLAAAEAGGQPETVRLIGIDAPEVAGRRGKAQCFALRAAGELSRLLDGKKVSVERDPLSDPTDRYGRGLAYLYIAETGKLVNGEMVRLGFARAYLRFPFKYREQFIQFEAAAKARKQGLWGKC